MRTFAVIAAVLICVGTTAASGQQDNWGQEVKSCNQSDCYPGGTPRGAYVRGQAQDADGPGYAAEIHALANPGKAEPKGKKFQ